MSRDDRIVSLLPPRFDGATYVSHYVPGRRFEDNLAAAERLLAAYASRARLIITTMLHCALPAVAMGIPTIVFYPLNTPAGHQSDRERFSSLTDLLPVYDLGDTDGVDWDPRPIPVGREKLRVVDAFYGLTSRWQLPFRDLLPRLAPASALPPP